MISGPQFVHPTLQPSTVQQACPIQNIIVHVQHSTVHFVRGSSALHCVPLCVVLRVDILCYFGSSSFGPIFSLIFVLRADFLFRPSGRLAPPIVTMAAALSSAVPEGVPPERHADLRRICSAWRGDNQENTRVMTLAAEALSVLGDVGWVTKQVVPNEAVGCLVGKVQIPNVESFLFRGVIHDIRVLYIYINIWLTVLEVQGAPAPEVLVSWSVRGC